MAEVLAASLFAAGYLAITMEERMWVNKAASSLVLAVLLWLIASLTLPKQLVDHSLVETGADIFGLIVFLLTAMTLVEILVHYRFFDFVELSLRSRGWDTKHLGWALAGIAFVFSGIIDNLTATIVTIQIARRLFPKQDILIVGAMIVIVANAGGAFSPIGDVTTLMLWFAGKFSASEILLQGFLPSLAMAAVPTWLLMRKIENNGTPAESKCKECKMSRSDKGIIAATLGSFLLPLVAAALGLPPYLGLIAGLGGVWILIDVAKKARPQETHLQAKIRNFMQQTDIESLQFFIGILLAVGALHALGILDWLTEMLLGHEPTLTRLVTTFISLGIGSAVVDNVPLTAAAISSLEGISSGLWVLLAITVGTGGSLLIVGSAAGVITMGMLPKMTFGKYLRIGTIPALLGFVAAVGVWVVQYSVFA